ncbi:MAG: hypothetical protein AAF430_23225 [Myxococcota bacterium]
MNAPTALPPPWTPGDLRRFLDTFLYRDEIFLIDEISRLDADAGRIEARLDTTQELPIARFQRVDRGHPAHVSAADMLILTGNLGCLHAWFFHGCKWDEGWSGFGNRIHRADFKRLARLGPPLHLESQETRKRIGPKRVVLRYEFHFLQEGDLVYQGDQSAMFFKDAEL